MSEIKVDTVKGRDGVVRVGDSGDTITVPSGATLTTTDTTLNLPATVTATTESKTNKISPASGTAFTFGDSGDTFTIPSGVTLANSGTASGFGAGPVLISSHTATDTTSIEITSGIDSTYDEYVLYFINLEIDYNGSQIAFQGSSDGGSSYGIAKTTTVFTATHSESGSSSLTYQTGQDLAQSTAAQPISYQQGGNAPSDECLCGEMHIYSPSSTTYVKHFTVETQFYTLNDESRNWFGAGYWNTTSAINALKFSAVQGNIQAGTIKMYGIA